MNRMSKPDFPQRRLQLHDLLQAISPHVVAYGVMDRYAAIRRTLRKPFGPGLIGDMDTLIAATALERNLTAVTADARFQRVPGLSVLLLDRETLGIRGS